MAAFDNTLTVNSLISQLYDLDAAHSTALTTTTVTRLYQNIFQINWPDGSLIRIQFGACSTTPAGVRFKSLLGGVGPSSPVVSSISPTTCVHGAIAFTLTVNGFGHVQGTQIIFDGVNLGNLTYVNDQQGTILVPATSVLAAKTVVVQTKVPGPQPVSNIASFVIT